MLNISLLWDDYSISTEEQKWAYIRITRNRLLNACDWTQLPDAPLTEEQKQAWGVYRQVLRDIPSSYTNADDVVFPIEP